MKTLHILLLTITISLATSVFAKTGGEQLYYYIDDPACYNAFTAHIEQIDIVAPAMYNVDADGIVWGSVDPRVLKLAKEHGVEVMPLIHNPGFNQEMLHDLLTNDVATKRMINSLVSECKKYGYKGIQFDFENLSINDKDDFTKLFVATAKALHKENFQLSIAVVHRPQEFPGPTKYFKWLHANWRAGYDLKALAAAGDFISLMSYSQHTRRTPPGPNASIPWMKKNIEYFLKYVPANKLSLGIPVTTMHWYTEQDDEKYEVNARSWSASISHEKAMGIVERHNAKLHWIEDQGVDYTFFDNGGLFEYIFFENGKSFERKLALIPENKLRGFSIWVIGREDPQIWDHLK
jgi:spore germination protein YaaH